MTELIVTGLYVPGDRPERFDKAVASGAELVILDLEDAVAADRKDAAREHVVAWLDSGRHETDGRRGARQRRLERRPRGAGGRARRGSRCACPRSSPPATSTPSSPCSAVTSRSAS